MKYAKTSMYTFLSIAIFFFFSIRALSNNSEYDGNNNMSGINPASLNLISFLHNLGVCHWGQERNNILFKSTTFSPSTIAPTNPGTCAPEATLSTQSIFWHIDGLAGRACDKEYRFVMDYTIRIKSKTTGDVVSKTSSESNVSCINHVNDEKTPYSHFPLQGIAPINKFNRGKSDDEDNWEHGLYISGPAITASWNGQAFSGNYVTDGSYYASIKAQLIRVRTQKEYKQRGKEKDNKGDKDDEEGDHDKHNRNIKIIGTGFTVTNAVYVDVTPPVLSFETPTNNALLCSASTLVTGTVNTVLPVAVYVNGDIASVYNDTFVVPYLPISDGSNLITAFATDACGLSSMQYINTSAQVQPPSGAVTYPSDGSYISTSTVDISGTYYENSLPTVTINGASCTVGYGTFECPNTPANEGLNTYNISLTNQCNESSNIVLRVTRNDVAPQVQILYPNIAYINKNTISVYGTVTSSIPVTVSVNGVAANVQGNIFTVSALQLTEGTNQIQVNATDAAGNTVSAGTVIIVDTIAPLVWVDLPATNITIATNQINIPVQTFDAAPVTITIGSFTTQTDSGIYVLKDFNLNDGLNQIVINVEDAAGNISSTSINMTVNNQASPGTITGNIMTNMGVPISGAVVSLLGTGMTQVADDKGAYSFTDVTPGQYIITGDGREVSSQYFSGETNIVVPAGENMSANTIFLTAVNPADGVYVDETKQTTLTFSQLPGFSMTVPARDVVFPDGSNSGTVYAMPVSAGTAPIPLPPNYFPSDAIELEPSGLTFSQPVSFTLPNLSGYAPGKVVNIYTSDEGLGTYIFIGKGTVSSDGTMIIPDVNVKISHFSVIFTATCKTTILATVNFITDDGIVHSCPSSGYYLCSATLGWSPGAVDGGEQYPPEYFPPGPGVYSCSQYPWLCNGIPIPGYFGGCPIHKIWLWATETISFPQMGENAPTPATFYSNDEYIRSCGCPNPIKTSFTIYVPRRTEVFGKVVDMNGNPIPGVRIVIYGQDSQGDILQIFPALYTGTNGTFDEPNVLGKYVEIGIEYKTYANGYTFPAGPDGGYTAVGDIVLPISVRPSTGSAFTVTGTLTAPWGPLRLESVQLIDPVTDAIVADSATDANGNFTFSDINRALFASNWFSVVHSSTVAEIMTSWLQVGVNQIPSDGSSVQVNLYDAYQDNNPYYMIPLSPVITGFTTVTSPVIISGVQTIASNYYYYGMYDYFSATVTNSTGNIETYNMNLSSPFGIPVYVLDEPQGPIHISYSSSINEFGTLASGQYDWYGYVLTPSTVSGTPLTISGTVSMPDGTPLSGARIRLFNAITGMNAGDFITYTNAGGSYTITGVPDGLLASNGSIGVDAYVVVNKHIYSGHTTIQVPATTSHVEADINVPQSDDLSIYPFTGSTIQSPFFMVVRYSFSGSYLRINSKVLMNNIDVYGNPTGISVNLDSLVNEDVQVMPVAFVPGMTRAIYDNGSLGTVFTVTGASKPTPPPPLITVSFTTPTTNNYTNQSSIQVGGSFSGDVSSIMLVLNGITQGYAFINPTTQTFTGTVDLSQQEQGYTQILALAISSQGAYAQTTTSLFYDTSSPSINISLPTPGSIVTASTIMINGFVTDTVTPANDITVWTPNSLVPCVNLSGSFTCLNVMLFDGWNNVIIDAADLAGNTATTTVSVLSATRPPLIAISSPSNGNRFASSAISVNGTVSDNYGLTLSVTVNGVNSAVSENSFFATGIALSGITNTIEAVATDSVGLSSFTTVSVTYQTAPTMSVTWAYPYEGDVESSTSIVAELDFTDTSSGINYSSIGIKLDGSPVDVMAEESYNDNAVFYLQNLTSGQHTLVASVLNGQGVLFQTATTFTVQPAISITSISPNPASIGQIVTIYGAGLNSANSICLTGDAGDNINNKCMLELYLPSGGGISPNDLYHDNDGSISFHVPYGAVTGDVAIGNVLSVSSHFTLAIKPTIMNLSPRIVTIGQIVSIQAAGLSNAMNEDSVILNNINCPVTNVANGTIQALIPQGASSGGLVIDVKGVSSDPVGLIVVDPSKHQITGIANSTNPITPGQTAIGYFSSSTQKDIYTFDAQQGSFINLDAGSIDDYGNIETGAGVQLLMQVYAPDGEQIASLNQPSTTNDTASIDNLYLNQSGTYSVVLSPSQNTQGGYQFSMTVPQGVYVQDVNPGIGITGNTVVLTGRDFTESPYIYFTGSTGAQLSYTSDNMTVGTSSVTFTMPAFTGTVVSMSTGSNQNGLPYTYADVISDVTVAHSAQPVPMYRENHQYWFSYPQQITGSTESYLNPATGGQLFTVPVSAAGTTITFTVAGVDNQGNTMTTQTIYPIMKLYTPSGFGLSASTNGNLSLQFAIPGVYQLAVLPVSGTSNLIKLDMATGYTSMSEPFHMSVVSSQLQLGLFGTTNQQPMTVLVTDQMQRPVSGVSVYFADNDKTYAELTGSNGDASAPAGTFTFDAQNGSVKFITVYIVDPTGNMMPGLIATFKMYTLLNPSAESGTPAYITAIDPTQFTGTVGATVPLRSVVTDAQGNPVKATYVEYRIQTGGATFGGNSFIDVPTDQYGVASAIVTLGTSTSVYPITVQVNADDPYPTQVGFTTIDASALSGNNIPPVLFYTMALPGSPANLEMENSGEQAQQGNPNMPLNIPIGYKTVDSHGNPVANSTVLFSVLPVTGTTGTQFINAKLYDDTSISYAKFSASCENGGAPIFRDDNCTDLGNQITTISRSDGTTAVIMYLGNIYGVVYNGQAALANGQDTQSFSAYADPVAGLVPGGTPVLNVECKSPLQNQCNIVNMYLPYPFQCTGLLNSMPPSANYYNTTIDTTGSYEAAINEGNGSLNTVPVYPGYPSIPLHPDSSGTMNIWLKLGGPTTAPYSCKGNNICLNGFEISGNSEGASVTGKVMSIGRDVQFLSPQQSQTNTITYSMMSDNSTDLSIPIGMVASISGCTAGAIDLSRIKFTFGLNITYPGWPNNIFNDGYDNNIFNDNLATIPTGIERSVLLSDIME